MPHPSSRFAVALTGQMLHKPALMRSNELPTVGAPTGCQALRSGPA